MWLKGLAPASIIRGPARVLKRWGLSLLWLLLCLWFSGCATEDFARRTGRGTVRGLYEGVGDLNDPLVQRLRQALLTDDILQKEAQAVARAVTLGIREGAKGSPDGGLAATAMVDELVGHAVAAALRAMNSEGGPMATQALRSARAELTALIRESLLAAGEGLHRAAERDLQVATRLLVGAAVDGAVGGIDRALRGPLGPEIERLLSENVARGVGKVARIAGKEAAAGVREGLKLELIQPLLSATTGRVESALWVVSFVFGTLVLLLGTGCLLLFRQYRLSTRTLAVVAGRINERRDPTLKREIQDHASRNDVQSWLHRFLRERGL